MKLSLLFVYLGTSLNMELLYTLYVHSNDYAFRIIILIITRF